MGSRPEQHPTGKQKKEALPSQNSSSRFPKPARYSAHFRKKSVWPFCRLWNTCGEGGGPVTPRKLSSRTAVARLCVRKGEDARVRAAAVQSAALSYAASLAAEARGPSLQGRGVRWMRQDCDVGQADSHPAAERGFGGVEPPDSRGTRAWLTNPSTQCPRVQRAAFLTRGTDRRQLGQ